jgi:hypothetical protein
MCRQCESIWRHFPYEKHKMKRIIKLPNGGRLVEAPNGNKFWVLNDTYHREDGPAIEYLNGSKEWWVNGERLPCTTQKQFKRLMRLKAFW